MQVRFAKWKDSEEPPALYGHLFPRGVDELCFILHIFPNQIRHWPSPVCWVNKGVERSQKYLRKIPSNVNQRLGRGKLTSGQPYRQKLNLFLTLHSHLEWLAYHFFFFFLVYLAIPGAHSAISEVEAAMGNGFISLSIMFTSGHSWLIISLVQPNQASQTSHQSHCRNCPETTHFNSLKADPEP